MDCDAVEKLEDWDGVGEAETAGAEAHADLIRFIGTTEVVPFYSAPFKGVVSQAVKSCPT